MNTKKTCFLHIGAPKTGSTALQKFLFENQAKLKELGWVYPEVSLRGYGHHDLAFLLAGGYPEWAVPQERSLEDLSLDLHAAVAGCSKIIISSENFYLYPSPEKLAELLTRSGFPPDTIRIVIYIRRQDEAHISWYNQVVKAQGYSGTIGQSIQDNFELWDYQTQLEKWTHVFGQKNIIVRPYEKEQLVGNDVRKDFLKLLDISQNKLIFPDKMMNTRLNRDILEFQRIINQLPISSKEKRSFHKEMIDLTIHSEGKELFDDAPLLSFEQCEEIILTYYESNHNVVQTYMGRENLFDNKLSHSYLQNKNSAGLSLEKLVYIIGWILIQNKQNYEQS